MWRGKSSSSFSGVYFSLSHIHEAHHTAVRTLYTLSLVCVFVVFSTMEAAVLFSLASSLFLFFLFPVFLFSLLPYLSEYLHKISDLWDESEPPLGRWDIDWLASMFIINSYFTGYLSYLSSLTLQLTSSFIFI